MNAINIGLAKKHVTLKLTHKEKQDVYAYPLCAIAWNVRASVHAKDGHSSLKCISQDKAMADVGICCTRGMSVGGLFVD